MSKLAARTAAESGASPETPARETSAKGRASARDIGMGLLGNGERMFLCVSAVAALVSVHTSAGVVIGGGRDYLRACFMQRPFTALGAFFVMFEQELQQSQHADDDSGDEHPVCSRRVIIGVGILVAVGDRRGVAQFFRGIAIGAEFVDAQST